MQSVESFSQNIPQPIENNSGLATNNDQNQPTVSNIAGQERQNNWARSVSRGYALKKTTHTVIQTRSQLVEYLRQSGLDLLTSSIEFQETGDFIQSSYVVFPQHNNQQEPLGSFLQRYEFLQAPAIAIRDNLKPLQNQMQIKSRKSL